jgi:hypothetical protein
LRTGIAQPHHLDAIGVLVASGVQMQGTAPADVERLYRICSLQRFGLSLSEIGRAFDDENWDLRSTVSTQLADVERRLEVSQRLRSRLMRMLGSVTSMPVVRTKVRRGFEARRLRTLVSARPGIAPTNVSWANPAMGMGRPSPQAECLLRGQ